MQTPKEKQGKKNRVDPVLQKNGVKNPPNPTDPVFTPFFSSASMNKGDKTGSTLFFDPVLRKSAFTALLHPVFLGLRIHPQLSMRWSFWPGYWLNTLVGRRVCISCSSQAQAKSERD